jgi:hypothetical protein
VRVKVELAEPVPEGMVGTLHLAWYDPDNTLGNEPAVPPAHNGHGRRDNAEDVELVEAGAPLPGFTLEFSTAGSSSTSDSIQKSYLAVKEARYADNFIVAAHLVILRIDADNNGYINMKNQSRGHAEIMLQRQGVAKPITYWGIEHPFGEENQRSEFVPMELEVRGQVGSPFIWYLQIPPTLGVYEFVNDQFIELADTLGFPQRRGLPIHESTTRLSSFA